VGSSSWFLESGAWHRSGVKGVAAWAILIVASLTPEKQTLRWNIGQHLPSALAIGVACLPCIATSNPFCHSCLLQVNLDVEEAIADGI
jgi:hypothetical protein